MSQSPPLPRSRSVPRRILYPVLAVFLATGSPLGLVILRCHAWSLRAFATCTAREIGRDLQTFAYLQCSTMLVFAALGFVLGRRVDALRATAVTDPLTGLANRRAFEARCAEALARAQRYGSPLSLLMIDLDGLKAINDQGGHAAGDRAIRAVAHTLSSNARAADTTARLGGDEFAVLAPETNAAQAEQLAARIHRALQESGSERVTVSIGIADLSLAPDATMTALLRSADTALYDAKATGRNRTSVFVPPTASRAEDATGS